MFLEESWANISLWDARAQADRHVLLQICACPRPLHDGGGQRLCPAVGGCLTLREAFVCVYGDDTRAARRSYQARRNIGFWCSFPVAVKMQQIIRNILITCHWESEARIGDIMLFSTRCPVSSVWLLIQEQQMGGKTRKVQAQQNTQLVLILLNDRGVVVEYNAAGWL